MRGLEARKGGAQSAVSGLMVVFGVPVSEQQASTTGCDEEDAQTEHAALWRGVNASRHQYQGAQSQSRSQ
jgi:hypothetical protein